MAYTAIVEKQSVSQISDVLYNISIKLTVNDGQTDVYECTANAKYNSNTSNLDNVKNELINKLKKQWDKYAAENNIYATSLFDAMVSSIQSAATVYVNQ